MTLPEHAPIAEQGPVAAALDIINGPNFYRALDGGTYATDRRVHLGGLLFASMNGEAAWSREPLDADQQTVIYTALDMVQDNLQETAAKNPAFASYVALRIVHERAQVVFDDKATAAQYGGFYSDGDKLQEYLRVPAKVAAWVNIARYLAHLASADPSKPYSIGTAMQLAAVKLCLEAHAQINLSTETKSDTQRKTGLYL